LELDSHADTCVLGRGALIIQDYDRPVNVTSYDPALGNKIYQTVTGVLGFVHPRTGQLYHLVLHQCIHIPHLTHHLLCPMQVRVNDVTINEVPKFIRPDPSPNTHSIIATEQGTDQQVALSLQLKGVTLYLPVLTVSKNEFESGDYPRIELTNEHLEWDPTTTTYEWQEEAMTNYEGNIVASDDTASRGRRLIINSLSTSGLSTKIAADVTDDLNFSDVLESYINVSVTNISNTDA
jgi:hypothetical protein